MLHLLGKTYSTLPSRIIGIDDSLAAYNFDLVVMKAGSDMEARAYEDMKNDPDKPGKSPEKAYGSWTSLARKANR